MSIEKKERVAFRRTSRSEQEEIDSFLMKHGLKVTKEKRTGSFAILSGKPKKD